MRRLSVLLFIMLAIAIVLMLGNTYRAVQQQAQSKAGSSFAAIPGTKGGQDIFGAYEVVKGWPKDISTVPGHSSHAGGVSGD